MTDLNELMPMIRLNAFVQASEPDEPLHWHAGECVQDRDGYPALLIVFHERALRDMLYQQLRDEVMAFLARLAASPESVQ